MDYLSVIVFLIVLATCLSVMIWTFKNGISPMPTSRKVANKLLLALPEKISGPIAELGAGWGTLAFTLADKYPENPIQAFESSPIPYYFMRIRQWLKPRKNLQLFQKDFFTHSLEETALVVCYLYPKAMQRLSDKFAEELPSLAMIVTHTFRVPGWHASQIIDCHDLYHTAIYIYVVKKEGR